jgi:hypothetical protein
MRFGRTEAAGPAAPSARDYLTWTWRPLGLAGATTDAWVTVTVCPATRTVAVRLLPFLLRLRVRVSAPLPVLALTPILIQSAVVLADQEQVDPLAVTLTVEFPPGPAAETVDGAAVKVHEEVDWLTV